MFSQFLQKIKAWLKKLKNDQTGWTTMEYVVGAIALVAVVSIVLNVFSDKLVTAIESLELI